MACYRRPLSSESNVHRIWSVLNTPSYDWCDANKQIKGLQHTVVWHVDDVFLTHKDAAVNDKLIDWLKTKYGNLSLLKVTRGLKHDYLFIMLYFAQQV